MTQQPMNQPWNPAQAPGPNPFTQAGQEVNPFTNATAAVGGDGAYPSNAQLVGRLLVFMVTSFTPQVPGPYGVQDQVIADTAILDGPPITEKLDGRTLQPTNPRQVFPFPLEAPYIVRGMTWSQKLMVQALRPHVGQGPHIGRLVKGPKRGTNDAPLKLEPATDAELQGIAMHFWRNREAIQAAQDAKWEAVAPQNPSVQAGQPGQYAGLNIAPVGQPAFAGQQIPQGWNPAQGPVTFNPMQAQQTGNGWGTPAQAPAQPSQVQDQPQGRPAPNPGAWTPEPQGAPEGWPTYGQ